MSYGFSGAITNMNKYKNKLKLYCMYIVMFYDDLYGENAFLACFLGYTLKIARTLS